MPRYSRKNNKVPNFNSIGGAASVENKRNIGFINNTNKIIHVIDACGTVDTIHPASLINRSGTFVVQVINVIGARGELNVMKDSHVGDSEIEQIVNIDPNGRGQTCSNYEIHIDDIECPDGYYLKRTDMLITSMSPDNFPVHPRYKNIATIETAGLLDIFYVSVDGDKSLFTSIHGFVLPIRKEEGLTPGVYIKSNQSVTGMRLNLDAKELPAYNIYKTRHEAELAIATPLTSNAALRIRAEKAEAELVESKKAIIFNDETIDALHKYIGDGVDRDKLTYAVCMAERESKLNAIYKEKRDIHSALADKAAIIGSVNRANSDLAKDARTLSKDLKDIL